jgi:hypothetical protein
VNDWTASVVTLTLVTKASSQFYQTCCPEKTRRDEQRPADSVIWISVSIPILTHWFSWAIGRYHRHIGCFGTVHKRRRRNSDLRFPQQVDFSSQFLLVIDPSGRVSPSRAPLLGSFCLQLRGTKTAQRKTSVSIQRSALGHCKALVSPSRGRYRSTFHDPQLSRIIIVGSR